MRARVDGSGPHDRRIATFLRHPIDGISNHIHVPRISSSVNLASGLVSSDAASRVVLASFLDPGMKIPARQAANEAALNRG